MPSNRRQRKKAGKRAQRATERSMVFGEIPGVPSFQGGGSVFGGGGAFGPSTLEQFQQTGSPFLSGAPGSGGGGGGGGGSVTTRDLGNGVLGVFDETGRLIDIRTMPSGGGGGGRVGPTQAELDLQSRQLDLTQRGQDIERQLEETNQAIARERQDVDRFIQAGQLHLAQQAEQRIREMEQQRIQLDRQRLQLEQERFEVERDLGFAGLGLDSAAQLGQQAANLGNIEARRAEFLSELAANPRDFAQLNIGLGGGQSFMNQLLGGQTPTGQSTAMIGQTPTLGPAWDQLVQAVTARPDLELFNQAQQAATLRPESVLSPAQQQTFQQFQQAAPGVDTQTAVNIARNPEAFQRWTGAQSMAKGGALVTDEPVVGIGQISGLPRFTVGEGGNPELLEVTPMADGGRVKSGLQNPFGGGTTPNMTTGLWRGPTATRPSLFPQPPLPPPRSAQPLPTGGIAPLLPPGVQSAVDQFGQGTDVGDIFRAVQAAEAAAAGQAGSGPVLTGPTSLPPPWGTQPGFPGPMPVLPTNRSLFPQLPGFGAMPGPRGPLQPPPPAPLPPGLFPAGPGLPGMGGVMPPPNIPAPIPGLTPEQNSFYHQFRAAAPNVPHETLMAIAQNPAAFFAWIGQPVPPEFQTSPGAAPAFPPGFPPGGVQSPGWPSPQPPSETSQMGSTPGEQIRRLMNFSPSSFFGMLPSQREFLASNVSALGVPPDDFFQSVIRSFPSSPNPAATTFGNFALGGRIIAG